MKPTLLLILGVVLSAFLHAPLCLAKGEPKKPVAHLKIPMKGPNEKTVTVNQEADQLEYDDKSKIMKLAGHVRLTEGDMLLEGDQATYYLNTEEAEATGNLKLTRPDGVLTGNHLHLYYREKRAAFDGSVSLLHYPHKGEKVKGNELVDQTPIRVSADELVYDWGAKNTVARGNVELIQADRKAFADHAVYSEPEDRLEMEGHVHLIRPPKDELECDHLVYLLNTNEAKAQGHVRGKFLVKESKVAPASPPAAPPAQSPMTTP